MGSTRQLIIVVNPKEGRLTTFKFADVVDGNDESKAFTCGYYPWSKGAGKSVLQETAFLGTTPAVGQTYQAFRDDKSQDGTTPIVARAITQRIDPDVRPDVNIKRVKTAKRFLSISFNGKSPSEVGLDVYYAKDSDPIKDPMVNWLEAKAASGDTVLGVEGDDVADWFNLRFECSGDNVEDDVLPAFDIGYYSMGNREGRDS